MNRVHIVGGGGSGKTWLGRKVSNALAIPVFELDRPGADVSTLDPNGRWVSEGIYLWQIERVLDHADVIVWLDVARRTALRRIVTRHILLSLKRSNPHPGFRRMLLFAWGQRDYYTVAARASTGPFDWDANSRASTMGLLEGRSNVVHLRTPRQVRRWLRSFTC